jgi:hydrogenase maturation protein HypF
MQPAVIRRTVDLTGVVQGIGFRPTLYRLAVSAGLGGWVQNRPGAVRLVLEGPPETVGAFLRDLPARLPPQARVEAVTAVAETALDRVSGAFHIRDSDASGNSGLLIPADLAVCPACRADVLNPADRRYGYAFTTCTACGPRYTVVTDRPYDRDRTTLAAFPMCERCRRDYDDPADRRFHAESIACPLCGPRLALEPAPGLPVPGDPLRRAREDLHAGRIVAVRGIGGFQLAADAFNRATLGQLRERKHRPHQPFAVMAPDIETARRYVAVPPEAARWLASPEAPIVILEVRPEVLAEGRLPVDAINPDTGTLGVMLPASPLHVLLLQSLAGDPVPAFDLLVMTSGNRRNEPICIGNDEARTRLNGIADRLLLHDREITLRNDDSVGVIQGGAPQLWRRARGYAPRAVNLDWSLDRVALGMGADMKNAMAVGYDRCVVLSPHVGDLDTPEAVAGFEQVVRSLPLFLDRRPEVIAVDLHPDMQATRRGRVLAEQGDLPVVAVQHHHAHAAACLAEHGLREGLALVMDGTGWGPDGSAWGAELLDVRSDGRFERCATFAPAHLPGGDEAVRRPARQLVARWVDAGVEVPRRWMERLGVTPEEVSVWTQQCRRGIHAPLSHAAGRLFDAWAAWVGCAPGLRTYEGQPAIRLEAMARGCRGEPAGEIPFAARELDGRLQIDWSPAFRILADADVSRTDACASAMAIHHAVARAAVEMVAFQCDHGAYRVIALSGGVFMNRILNDLLVPRLEGMGLRVLRHRQTPPGDGCIALGQVVVAGSGT